MPACLHFNSIQLGNGPLKKKSNRVFRPGNLMEMKCSNQNAKSSTIGSFTNFIWTSTCSCGYFSLCVFGFGSSAPLLSHYGSFFDLDPSQRFAGLVYFLFFVFTNLGIGRDTNYKIWEEVGTQKTSIPHFVIYFWLVHFRGFCSCIIYTLKTWFIINTHKVIKKLFIQGIHNKLCHIRVTSRTVIIITRDKFSWV